MMRHYGFENPFCSGRNHEKIIYHELDVVISDLFANLIDKLIQNGSIETNSIVKAREDLNILWKYYQSQVTDIINKIIKDQYNLKCLGKDNHVHGAQIIIAPQNLDTISSVNENSNLDCAETLRALAGGPVVFDKKN
jgi:hypothetical protein|tara:strand:- start:3799 stop:4209 length:411 start_codon:yes stop_codon:yes gene_type:complete